MASGLERRDRSDEGRDSSIALESPRDEVERDPVEQRQLVMTLAHQHDSVSDRTPRTCSISCRPS